MRSESHHFTNGDGHRLAAMLDLPSIRCPRAYALFAHCFTCNKDLRAIRNISTALTGLGLGVFRFDFPGLGQSDGCFSETTFSTNVDDLYRAALFLEEIAEAPQILIGHSLGGAAVIQASTLIKQVRAVATIGAPADPAHVIHLLGSQKTQIETEGQATVSIAKREFLIKKAFIDDLEAVSMEEATHRIRKALLIFHSPADDIVEIDNAARIYERAAHPKSFISLDQADHMLTREEDSQYVGHTIGAWAERYLAPETKPEESGEVIARIGKKGLRTNILSNGQPLIADEPIDIGGTNLGPTPYDYLTAGLGACTAMTLRLYADRKKWPLDAVQVRLKHDKLHAKDCESCETETGRVDVIERTLVLEGDLDESQRARLAEIADRCPVHRTLESEVKMVTKVATPPG